MDTWIFRHGVLEGEGEGEEEEEPPPELFLPVPAHVLRDPTVQRASRGLVSIPQHQQQHTADPFAQAMQLLNALTQPERSVLPKLLNPMQLQVLPVALGSNQSMVLSAPTGAGKTCVLDMALLRSVVAHEPGTVRVYYVAPSRALCRLQAEGFANRFKQLHLDVVVRTGDEDGVGESTAPQAVGDGNPSRNPPPVILLSKHGAGNAHGAMAAASHFQLVACTPEKLEAETRKMTDGEMRGGFRGRSTTSTTTTQNSAVLLVDEIHHIGDKGRGGALELALTRFLWAFRDVPDQLRFVCISATIPNSNQVGLWLRRAHVFQFLERPIPLNIRVVGVPRPPHRTEFLFEKDLDRHVPQLLREFGRGKPALVFVTSRKNAKDLALELKDEMRDAKRRRQQEPSSSATTTTTTILTDDPALRECLAHGVGFHSAELSLNDRTGVETMFAQNKLSVVCCTSTLAVGVDLPASLVIVKSTRAYRGPNEGYQDLDRTSIIQMIGRAGRPGHDSEGHAIILTEQASVGKYQDLSSSNGLLPVQSQLVGDAIGEGLNAELVRERLRTREDCVRWWSMTFASQTVAWDDAFLGNLVQLNCVTEQPMANSSSSSNVGATCFASTGTGRIASSHHIKLATIARFALECGSGTTTTNNNNNNNNSTHIDNPDTNEVDVPPWTLERACRIICEASEFQDLVLRRDQKKFLNTVAWTEGRFKSRKSSRVADAKDMAFQLMQCQLAGKPIANALLRQQCAHVFNYAPRLARSLLRMLVEAKSSRAIVCALLCRVLDSRSWETDEVGQLDGIGAKTKEKLGALGISKLQHLVDGIGSNSTSSSNTNVPAKALAQARTLLGTVRAPNIFIRDSAMVVQVPVAQTNQWTLACVGGEHNRLLAWSERLPKVVFPVSRAEPARVTVFVMHRKFHGLDTKLCVDVVHGTDVVVRSEQRNGQFWEGFYLSSSSDAPSSVPASRVPQMPRATSKTARKGEDTVVRSNGFARFAHSERDSLSNPGVREAPPPKFVDSDEEMATFLAAAANNTSSSLEPRSTRSAAMSTVTPSSVSVISQRWKPTPPERAPPPGKPAMQPPPPPPPRSVPVVLGHHPPRQPQPVCNFEDVFF